MNTHPNPDSDGPGSPDHATQLQRRFSDEEIRRVLRDAAELQVGQSVTGGLTLEELRNVAAEAGIDPRFIDLAAASSSAPEGEGGQRSPGRAYRWRLRRVVHGTVPPEHLDRLLHAIRRVFGEKGELDLVSGRMEWTGAEGVVGVATRGMATEIDVSADQSLSHGVWHLALTVFGFAGGAIVGAVAGVSGLLLLLCGGLGAVGGHAGARKSWSRHAKSFEAKLQDNLDQVAAEAAAQAREGPGATDDTA